MWNPDAITALVHDLIDARSLFRALPVPLCAWVPAHTLAQQAAAPTWSALSELLSRLAPLLDLPPIELRSGPSRRGVSIFESALGERLVALLASAGLGTPDLHSASLEALAEAAKQQSFEARFPLREILTADGVHLQTFAAGGDHARRSAVLLVLPCAMPAPLLRPWMQFWSREHFVMTWESRGLFGAQLPFDDDAGSVERQVDDLFCVMDGYGVGQAHVMGSCGGAPIALVAAAQRPERVSSLSLWHGAFDLGSDAAKTEHERNLAALLKLAAEDRASAAAVRSLLCQRAATGVPAEMAQLVLYPFANDELMYRYAILNGALLAKDVRPLLPLVVQRTLVVTSRHDTTTHPEASHRVAERLPDALLHVTPEGDHLSHFRADPAATRLAASFLLTGDASLKNPNNRSQT